MATAVAITRRIFLTRCAPLFYGMNFKLPPRNGIIREPSSYLTYLSFSLSLFFPLYFPLYRFFLFVLRCLASSETMYNIGRAPRSMISSGSVQIPEDRGSACAPSIRYRRSTLSRLIYNGKAGAHRDSSLPRMRQTRVFSRP